LHEHGDWTGRLRQDTILGLSELVEVLSGEVRRLTVGEHLTRLERGKGGGKKEARRESEDTLTKPR